MKIPFNQIYTTGRELQYIENCVRSGHTAGNGPYTDQVQELLSERFSCPKVFLTTSCTAALEMAALLVGLKPGDEVIMPSFTFVSTANAVMLRGAQPVFADINPETLNLDPDSIRNKVTDRTRAIIPVHYAGTSCDMNEINAIAREYDLMIIEDAAQAVNAMYNGRYLGTLGHFGCFSFHTTKNYSCGEGGALLVNSNDIAMIEKAEIAWEKGTNRSQYLHGKVNKYSWMNIGSSYLPSDILAAYLLAQLEEMDEINRAREKIYFTYLQNLREYQDSGLIKLPVVPDYALPNYHIFYIQFTSMKIRDAVLHEMRKCGVEVSFHYLPLHTSHMGQKLGYSKGDLPLTEAASENILRLPLYPNLSDNEQDYILSNLRRILLDLA